MQKFLDSVVFPGDAPIQIISALKTMSSDEMMCKSLVESTELLNIIDNE